MALQDALMSGKPRGQERMGQPVSIRFEPQELVRWKADAARKGRKLSEHVRVALNRELMDTPAVVTVRERAPDPLVPELTALRGVPPAGRVSSGCPADVSKGVRCRLCHKIH